jgi:hypothetical protein
MKHKILIIEDKEIDYNRLVTALTKYDVEYFPADRKQFLSFSKSLMDCARSNCSALNLDKLKEILNTENPTIILLDIGLLGTKISNDESGLVIYEKLIRESFSNVTVFFLSAVNNKYLVAKYQGVTEENFIPKHSYIGLENELVNRIYKTFGIFPRYSNDSKTTTTARIDTVEEITPDMSLNYEKTEFPIALVTAANLERFKIEPVVTFWLDALIRYTFYLVIVLSFLLAPGLLFHFAMYEHFSLMHLAENVFLVFLPFLILSGFFFFYMKELNPFFTYFKGDVLFTPEMASTLINLTKKLFISSLISYLFINAIEIILNNRGNIDETLSHFDIATNSNPLIKLYCIGGVILTLIAYYFFLSKKH